jgi:hypothetical protein
LTFVTHFYYIDKIKMCGGASIHACASVALHAR